MALLAGRRAPRYAGFMLSPDDPVASLLTIRDWLRHCLTRFRKARAENGISHGHGGGAALDEAAFLILEALSLPVDDINPWLDARLTLAERERISSLIAARIATRKPLPYLLGATWLQGRRFRVDERVIVPRSFIAGLLFSGAFGSAEGEPGTLIDDPLAITRVLDLCTGSGCLAILAADAFPNATIDAVDLSGEALEVARANVRDHGLEERVTLFEGDLFAPLRRCRYDLIITNPPYVTTQAVTEFPPEYAAEPVMAHLGGDDGLDIVHRILEDAAAHLTEGGGLICEVGSGREALEATRPDLSLLWLDAEGHEGADGVHQGEGEVFWITRPALG
jgi:ribosomal protein L3 glutamine methyltransferase